MKKNNFRIKKALKIKYIKKMTRKKWEEDIKERVIGKIVSMEIQTNSLQTILMIEVRKNFKI
jgi:hypothetical protein